MSATTSKVGRGAVALHGQTEEHTYEAIRHFLVTGELSPGSPAAEIPLARRLGVSRTPVRAAIARLAREGFLVPVTKGRRIEYAAAPLSTARMRELWGIIGALEGNAMRGLDRLSPEERLALADDLATVNRDLEAAAAEQPRDVERLANLQAGFHYVFMKHLSGPHLTRIYDGIRPHIRRFELAYGARPGAPYGPSIAEHADIIATVRSGDGMEAACLIISHWAAGAERTARVMEATDRTVIG